MQTQSDVARIEKPMPSRDKGINTKYWGWPSSAAGIKAAVALARNRKTLEVHKKITLFPILSMKNPRIGHITADIKYGVAYHVDAYFSSNPNLSKSMSSAFATYTITTMCSTRQLPHTSQKGSLSVHISFHLNLSPGFFTTYTSSFFSAQESIRTSINKVKRQATQMKKPTNRAYPTLCAEASASTVGPWIY